MKYLVGRRENQLQIRNKEIPVPAEGEVLVKVFGCGVCGTDLHFLRVNEDWTPLGHEISGEIVAVGAGVHSVQIGDRVVVEDVGACGCCPACQNGKPGLCTAMKTLNEQSGMGEYLVVPATMVVSCAGLGAMEACLVEPLTVCVHAVQATKLPVCGTLAVWGIGPLGLMSIRVAKYLGAGKVIAVASRRDSARNAHRASVAKALGADEVLYSNDADFREQFAAQAQRIDAALVTSPPKTLPLAVETVSYGGRVVPIGIDLGGNSVVSLDVDELVLQKKSIIPMLSEPAVQFPLSVELLRHGVIPTEQILTHVVPISETEKLLQILQKDPTAIKVIVVPDGWEEEASR